MTLPTTADLPLRSPIPPVSPARADLSAAELTLADRTGLPLWQLRGAEIAVRAARGELPEQVGAVLADPVGLTARLTDDEWLHVAAPGAELPELPDQITATDLTHGYGAMELAGPAAGQMLSKLCGLDFADSAFPDLHSAQTSLAKVRAIVLRRDRRGRPAYLIAVGRSLARYVWQQLLDAGAEFGIAVVDAEGLES